MNNTPQVQTDVIHGIRRAWWCFATVLCGLATCTGWMAEAPDARNSVVVVFNAHSEESKAVAEHYARARSVPAEHLLGLKLPRTETMSRLEYRKMLEEPLRAWLEDGKRWVYPAAGQGDGWTQTPSQAAIRYAVLCYEVPLKIEPDPSVREPDIDNLPQELRRNEAAVDSELALLPVRGPGVRLTGPATHKTFASTNRLAMHPTNGVFIVARLDGPTPDIAKGLVDKALAAETNGMWGRAYFDLRGIKDGPYKLGDDILRGAHAVARRQGFETELDEAEPTLQPGHPMSHVGMYCGWYAEDANGPFLQSSMEFMPGAFAYHLHSFSAATLRSTSRHWCGPLLARGATITMGCVYEPYLGGTPDIGVVLSRLIDLGFTFGEAALAGQQVLSWQTTVVGDPLYRPFARPAREMHESLAARGSPAIEWSHLRVVNLNLATGMREPQLLPYLEEVAPQLKSAVLTEKLASLYHASGKPASAIRTVEDALRQYPSAQQEIRMSLVLMDWLAEDKQFEKAVTFGEAFLKQQSSYAGASALYRKLALWAASAGNMDAAARFEKAADALKR